MHIGVVKACRNYYRLMVDISQRQTRLQSMPQSSNPMQQHILQTETLTLDKLISQSFAIKTALMAPSLLERCIDFYAWTCSWLLHLAGDGGHSSPHLSLVVEYIVDDFQEFFTFLARFKRELVAASQHRLLPILKFMTVFMAGQHSLQNPHLRGQFPEVILLFLPDPSQFGQQVANGVICTDPFLQQHLLPNLLELYVKVEYGDNQFYDKFTTRHHVSQILKMLWHQPQYHGQLLQLCGEESAIELFINAVINDLMFLLDESLSNLQSIREFELLQVDQAGWDRLPRQQQQEKETRHRQMQRSTTSLMRLANTTIAMIHLITKDTIAPFVSPGFNARVAAIIAFYIDKLVGPEVSHLKVKSPEQYEFFPRTLLAEIVGIFIDLAADDDFVVNVARDDRSYKKEVFAKALRTVSKKRILGEADVSRFDQALRKVASAAELAEDEEEELGEVPEEYLDPISAQLMTDPVLLPSSKQTLDRSTIKRHLMNTPKDPFNRAPLQFSEVESNTALKREIDEWVAARKKGASSSTEKKSEALTNSMH